MHPLTLETDHRPSTPPAARSGGANGDLFAMLLRQHADTKDAAAPRPRGDSARDDDPVAPAPRHRATERRERAAEANDERASVDTSPARTDAASRDDTGDTAPDAAADAGPATDSTQPPADPVTTPAVAAPTVPTDPAAAPTPVAATSEISVTLVAAVPPAPATTPSAPASTPAATPAMPATAAPSTGTDATAPADDAAPAPTAPATAGTAAAPKAAAPSLPSATQPDAVAAEPATTSTEAATEGEIQISRAPAPAAAATATAHGLGKLGSGAEIALAAQAAGEAGRTVGVPGDTGTTAKKPGAGTAQQTSATAQGDGKPASGAPVAPARVPSITPAIVPASVPGSAAAQPQPPAGIQLAASFEATLNGAASDAEFVPGGATGAGALQGSALHGTAAASATPKAAAAAAAAPAEQLGVHIQRAVRDGNTRITVQLNPVELGQVEVHLDFASDGRVSATILADRADTLDMLQRDARLLERSLQDAGLQTGNGSLSFDLRDGGRQGFGQQALAQGHEAQDTTAKSDGRKAAAVEQAPPASKGITDSGVDIHV